MYFVVAEWDGKKPPTTWYNRCRSFGLSVRGDKSASPIERRQSGMLDAVIVQEGVVLAASESLVRELGMLANELGASVVKIGRAEVGDFFATTEDVRIHKRIEDTYGKRGRPTTESGDFDVICMEECEIFPVNDVRYAVSCPHCGGFHVKSVPAGKLKRFRMPDDVPTETLVQRWMRAAFANGEFTPTTSTGDMPPAAPRIPMNGESKVVDIMARSEALGTPIEKLQADTAGRLLDAIFASKMVFGRDARINARIRASVVLMSSKVDPSLFSVAEDDHKYDILDAAPVLGDTTTAAIWKSVHL